MLKCQIIAKIFQTLKKFFEALNLTAIASKVLA